MLNNLLQVLKDMHWSDYLDICVVAFLIYKILPLFRTNRTMQILRAILFLFVAVWLTSSDVLNMKVSNFLLSQVTTVGLLALVVLFQPELRRILDHVGNVKLSKIFASDHGAMDMSGVITQTVMACEQLSKEKIGALIVFHRDNALDEYMKTGTIIDGQVSEQLIRNVFFPKAALHDGAMIIRDGRVTAAGCVLPLSESNKLSLDLGTRHRAGVGMSEVSDAVVVIVSEERGTISVAVGGMLKQHLAPKMLERILRSELMPEGTEKEENLALKLKQKLRKNGKGGGEA
jgi:diadenylate cyclase